MIEGTQSHCLESSLAADPENSEPGIDQIHYYLSCWLSFEEIIVNQSAETKHNYMYGRNQKKRDLS